MKQFRIISNEDGFSIALVLAASIVLISLGVILAQLAVTNIGFDLHEQRSATAMNIAEAGVNYYMWHLSHNTTDYQDGTGAPASPPYGPYVHNYYDTDGKLIGTFTLTITPPVAGSTVTTVKSVGAVTGLKATRDIQAQLGIPSFASYALLTNSEVWFGSTESSNGPVMSNVGVHFDGTNNGPVTAAVSTYVPSASYGGDGNTHNGVWGNGGPTSEWQFPVPSVDFNSVTANLSTLQTAAQSGGVYLASLGSFNSKRGYYLVLKNNGTIDEYKVTNESSGGITTTFIKNQAAPGNGILYVADNVWVSGTYNGRITIASGRLPQNSSTNTTIKITNNLLYTAKDGTVSIGLIAQQDIQLAQYVPNNMEIDAALLAQNGSVYMPYYNQLLGTLTFYGALATNGSWTWNYCSFIGQNCVVNSGYASDTNTFDSNLLYSPPPSFPTTGSYTILNWRELLSGP
ncbi:MAG: hypothetical protein ACHQUB_00415 [Candidatus Saccharimonadia bacterium]